MASGGGSRSQQSVSDIYSEIMNEVIRESQRLFVEDGSDPEILLGISTLWREKLAHTQTVPTGKDALGGMGVSSSKSWFRDSDRSAKRPLVASSSSGSSSNRQQPTPKVTKIVQLDGTNDESKSGDDSSSSDSSSDDSSSGSGSSDTTSEEGDKDKNGGGGADSDADDADKEPPIGSDDDLTDPEDPEECFATENIMSCKYKSVSRKKGNRFEIKLKDVIAHINGKDLLFNAIEGEAVWRTSDKYNVKGGASVTHLTGGAAAHGGDEEDSD